MAYKIQPIYPFLLVNYNMQLRELRTKETEIVHPLLTE